MALSDDVPSSPPNATTSAEDALSYYKAQYEALEAELADFQETSRALEADLEKDIDASEKRERQLKEKADNLQYEVDEWKAKYKQAKSESGSVQNKLQKEITTLRDQNRTLQLKLRDIEVANDDFERQARNTESSLEDLESKYNVAIERGVMLEEEVRVGEQEREQLRIETQRLRDELSDMKIEAEIIKEKLQNAEQSLAERPTMVSMESVPVPQSPRSEKSQTTTASSPIHTPPTKSVSSGPSDVPTPPSPPSSETSGTAPKPFVTPSIPKSRLSTNGNATPRPIAQPTRPAVRHSRGPSIPVTGRTTPSMNFRSSLSKPLPVPRQPGLPQSNSIYQLRNLRGKMQRLEERVHSAKSKLPAPITTPPRASPRSGSALGHNIPSSVTVRSSRRRTGTSSINGSQAASEISASEETPSLRQKPSRLSFNRPPPTPTRHESRPASRTSNVSSSHRQSGVNPYGHGRPGSRQSISGARTPLGYHAPNASTDRIRPKSSLSSYDGANDDIDEEPADGGDSMITPTPRRSTFGRTSDVGLPASAIPTPAALKKRESVGSNRVPTISRRISSAGLTGDMRPGSRTEGPLEDVDETY